MVRVARGLWNTGWAEVGLYYGWASNPPLDGERLSDDDSTGPCRHGAVPSGFCDSAIAEFIAKSRKLRNFRMSSQVCIITVNFPQILNLDAPRDVTPPLIQSKKVCFSVWKIEWTALNSQHDKSYIDLQELHWTNEPKAERIHAARLVYTAQTVYLLVPEPRDDLDHATPLYTAGRYSEESSRIHRRINNISA